ncbi:MAG TPA: carboxy-S-adenosyl-L-methionine synthase CmoA, partial [Methylophaga sp.]|nr:carboxy-S-adenosyl-L-methionine synthase CmoA [Methylophaga sp.]
MIKKADNIFASPLEQMVDFRFDERVVDVFPDMIQRSVPGYGTLISN